METKQSEIHSTTLLPFSEFKQAVQRQFLKMRDLPIFRVDVHKDLLWQVYLESFPDGSNPLFRERTEHDCSCCRSFVKNAGSMVAIVDGELVSIWDIELPGSQYQPVADNLSELVKSCNIENVFLHDGSSVGTDCNREDIDNRVVTWEHFHLNLPSTLHCADRGPKLGEYTALHDVMLRSLTEIDIDAVDMVIDLVQQNSLYRGEEKLVLLRAFAEHKRKFDTLFGDKARDRYAWMQAATNAWLCRMRNDVIGTLLVDLSTGVDLYHAVKTYEDKVSGTNYKRPTALVTPKMRDNARAAIAELGYMTALDRRYAKLEDVNVTNVLFADRSVKSRMSGDVFDEIQTTGVNARNFDKVEEISIDKFISDVLPTATKLEVLFENKHASNLVSLIAPYDLTAKTMFKWHNPFSWSYVGDVADSIKERVKAAGGNVTGDVCCRLAWYNTDDLDLHMVEPDGVHIYYGDKHPFATTGTLDVDMNVGGDRTDPVENIVYPSVIPMRNGTYKLSVNQYTKRNSHNVGFEVEIDVLGEVHSFVYDKLVVSRCNVDVANIIVDGNTVKVVPVLESTSAVRTRNVWGIDSQKFHQVSALMLSPNFWDGDGIGNKHYFFMLDGCRNDGSARGFYNEFLKSELEPHRKTMEIVGSKMRTEEAGDQLSGIGFSSTQRNTLVVRVHGSFVRTLKINL